MPQTEHIKPAVPKFSGGSAQPSCAPGPPEPPDVAEDARGARRRRVFKASPAVPAPQGTASCQAKNSQLPGEQGSYFSGSSTAAAQIIS